MPEVSKRMPVSSPASAAPAAAASTVRIASRCSRDGVPALIEQACAQHEAALLGQALTPLFVSECPWQKVDCVPPKLAQNHTQSLSAVTAALMEYRCGLTATAGHLAGWLDASEEDIRHLALQFAKLDLSNLPDLREPGRREALLALPSVVEFPGIAALLSQPVLPASAMGLKLLWAQTLLGAPVAGKCAATKFARISDARFWRRAIRVILMREREHFFLRLRLVGTTAEAYVSDAQLSTRIAQLKRQQQWMKETVLVPRYLCPGSDMTELLTLKQVASSPKTRFAKLYAFVKAMDDISQEQDLATGMLTLTLEPQWHPNPSHGANSWNGASPRQAHQSMATRWQSVLRDLDRLGVGLSGLRVVEPHKDGCPHWHLWLLYQPEAETAILRTVMKYFPNKLKIRNPRKAKAKSGPSTDVMYDNLESLRSGVGRCLTHPKEGAQVELARIDRSIGSGASYAMKYLLKTVDGGEQLNQECGLFPDEKTAAMQEKRQAQLAVAKRVDAYRSLWGINAAQLFGVAKCLTAWDEFRRLNTAPSNPQLKKLWALARGTDNEGRIPVGAAQRGDAKGFLQALGGLAACRPTRAGKVTRGKSTKVELGRLTETGTNGYGEDIERTKGLVLLQRHRVRVVVGEKVSIKTGRITPKTAWRTIKVTLASVRTRLGEWMMVQKKHQTLAIAQAEQRFMEQPNTPAPAPAPAPRRCWPTLAEALAGLGLIPAPSPSPGSA